MSLKELKDVIKQANILDIVSHYLSVNKKGSNYESLCPFHNDSKPSLKINPQKGLFKCFACDTAGDGISFIQQIEKVEFVDALKKAAHILNIPLDNYLQAPRKNPKKEMGYRVLRAAQNLYTQYAQSQQFNSIYQGFLQSRGLTSQTAQEFGLGYTPGRKSFYRYLQSIPQKNEQNFALQEATELGLIRNGDYGYYDYFNNRITFPIWDHFGAVVGFGSRVLNSDQQPKYLNSKESYLFNKRNLLYGFHLAKQAIREKDMIILVEGYMDAIALYQAGFKQTVAIMGVAISEQNTHEIARLTKNVFLALDNDQAGLKAMERVNHEFLKIGIIPQYLDFSPHNDPDDYIKEKGAKSFQELLQQAQSFTDFQLTEISQSLPENASSQVRSEALEEGFKLLSPLGLNILATEKILKFSQNLGLKTQGEMIIDYYKKYLSQKTAPSRYEAASQEPEMPPSPTSPPAHFQTQQPEPPTPLWELSPLVRSVLKNLTSHPQLYEELNIAEVLDFLSQNEVKRYIDRAAQIYFECDSDEYEKVLRIFLENNSFPEPIKQVVYGELFQKKSLELEKKEQVKMAKDIIRNLQVNKLKLERKKIEKNLAHSKTVDEEHEKLKAIHQIDRQLEQLKH